MTFQKTSVETSRLTYLDPTPAELLGNLETSFYGPFQIAFEPSAEVFEHRGSPRQNNVAIQASSHINRAVLDALVHGLGYGHGEIRISELESVHLAI